MVEHNLPRACTSFWWIIPFISSFFADLDCFYYLFYLRCSFSFFYPLSLLLSYSNFRFSLNISAVSSFHIVASIILLTKWNYSQVSGLGTAAKVSLSTMERSVAHYSTLIPRFIIFSTPRLSVEAHVKITQLKVEKQMFKQGTKGIWLIFPSKLDIS